MKKEKKGFLLRTVPQINRWTGISGVGFLLYLGAAALELRLAADVIAVVFVLIALRTFLSAADLRGKDKEAVTYNLLWGTGALTLLLGACVALAVKTRFGL